MFSLLSFGVSTVGKCIRQVTSAILCHMYRAYIRLPTGEEATQNSDAWERRTRIPSIMGGLDQTWHFPSGELQTVTEMSTSIAKAVTASMCKGCNDRFIETNCSSCRLQETIYRSRSRLAWLSRSLEKLASVQHL